MHQQRHLAARPGLPADPQQHSWRGATRYCLEGHLAPIIATAIAPSTGWLITAAEDRTFKVWDLAQQRCVYQSEILSPTAQLTSLDMGPRGDTLYVGADDGTLRTYQLAPVVRAADVLRGKSDAGNAVQPQLRHTVNVAQWLRSTLAREDEAEAQPETITISTAGRPRMPAADSAVDLFMDDVMSCSPAILACHVVGEHTFVFIASHVFVADAASGDLRHAVNLCAPTPVVGSSLFSAQQREHALGLTRAVALLDDGAVDGEECSDHVSWAVVPLFAADSPWTVLSLSLSRSSVQLDPGSSHEFIASYLAEHAVDTRLDQVLPVAIAAAHGGASAWTRATVQTSLDALHRARLFTVADLLASRGADLAALGLPMGVAGLVADIVNVATALQSGRSRLSFDGVPESKLDAGSPLRKWMWASKSAPVAGKKKLLDKPVTFHAKVRSSGYTAAPVVPRHLAMQRQKRGGGTPASSAAMRPRSATPSEAGGETSGTWAARGATSALAPSVVLAEPIHPASISAALFAPCSGRYLALGTNDGAVLLARPSPAAAESRFPVLATHRLPGGAVNSVGWSHDESMVVASTASTVSVWRAPSSASAVPATAAAIEDARILDVNEWYSAGATVSAAQFFYQSKFLLVAAGDRVELLKYRTSAADTVGGGTEKRKLLTSSASLADVAPRRLATTMAKRVWSAAALDGSHGITAMAACNATPSPLIVHATSGKALCIADANTGTIVTKIASGGGGGSDVTLDDPAARFLPPLATATTAIPPSLARHPLTRAIHAIRVLDPAFCTTPGAAHLFMTTAAGDLVKLWDVRTASPVVRLGAALPAPRGARTIGSGASISPCGTLVAAPTGDASCAIAVFDVRNAQIAVKLPAAVPAMSAVRRRVAGPAAGAGRRPGSAMGSGSAARASPAFGSSTASTGVAPVVPTMGGEDAGAVDFHPIRSALVAGTTRGNGVLFRL
ncbi:hypothetical protein H9P43_002369 [Blastocladiella emersonii ATCC 22665]|nr:hypothetical protein H9P43_002369 [Blastocladiella emersonii ATCC 22665]